MQQILNVLTPADTYDLVSLANMKAMLLVPPTDTSKDLLIQTQITQVSEMVAKLCNRVFAYEEVDETFYQLNDEYGGAPPTQRLYLSRWPVVLDDIEALTLSIAPGDTTDLLPEIGTGSWVLEEETGTLYQPAELGPWYGTVEAVYSGGYDLPDDAPGLVQYACGALIREGYMAWIRNPALFGVRQLAHKESRIGYYSPAVFPTLGLPDTWKTVESLLSKYVRHWV